MPAVTRHEIRALEGAFTFGPASRSSLVAHANSVQAPPHVVHLLEQLPYPLYEDSGEVWQDVFDLAAGGYPHPNPVGVCA